MAVIVVIPARLGSTRFPGKVLADRTGHPLIWHVWKAALAAQLPQRVVVAADDPRVIEAVRRFGGECISTSPEHPNGTSRLAESADVLGLSDDDIVVNVQGDEPEIDPALIDAAVAALKSALAPRPDAPHEFSRVVASTIGSPFRPGEDASNPNIVKVVIRRDGRALYFSRALVPHERDGAAGRTPETAKPLRHVGLYCYTAGFLRRYAGLSESPLERAEKLEQLRILEHGFDIVVAVREARHAGIDTPEQYEEFVARWRRSHTAGAR